MLYDASAQNVIDVRLSYAVSQANVILCNYTQIETDDFNEPHAENFLH